MSDKETGGPAFPRPISVSHGGYHEHQHVEPPQDGMTLRDYFAAKAMQAYFNDPMSGFGSDVIEYGCGLAYKVADAMLEARK